MLAGTCVALVQLDALTSKWSNTAIIVEIVSRIRSVALSFPSVGLGRLLIWVDQSRRGFRVLDSKKLRGFFGALVIVSRLHLALTWKCCPVAVSKGAIALGSEPRQRVTKTV